MSHINNEVMPANEIVFAVIEQVMVPMLKDLEIEMPGHDFTNVVEVFDGETPGILILVTTNEQMDYNELDAPGNTRLRVRKTGKEGTYLFHYESIYTNTATEYAFSGFAVKGRIKHINDTIIAEKEALIIRRNVFRYIGWF